MRQYLCGWIGSRARWSSKRPLAALLSVLLVSAGCQFFAQRSGIPTDYNLPLTVQLRMDPSIAAASIEYRNACGQAVAVPIYDALQKELKRRLMQVFERVQVEAGASTGVPDGVVVQGTVRGGSALARELPAGRPSQGGRRVLATRDRKRPRGQQGRWASGCP